ncbi:helix-turn-helix domain-containing protein [Paenibacillus thalictri]|uniref:ATP-binding protein n=1 Tax=Paenibacillus thalictri TaxID=2527873 RepID=A0A4Q9DFT1_9BACL|nr:ATP-binding protein [Paenibacillus thalictri]TBL69775.1 ATP-binding protein [Paenibacillus thalictri]
MQLPISKPYEVWNEEDLRYLCSERIAETQRLDYKKELKLDPPRERRELLKDVTSLANSSGGIIIYGIEESKHPDLGSIGSSLNPIRDAALIDIANRVVRTHISPALEVYFHSIPATDGGYYLLVYVPQSIFRPHAIVWEKRLDYYIRRNQDNFPMTESEVRDMYRDASNSQLTLKQRYMDLDTNNGQYPCWKVLSMPVVPGIELLNTLTIRGQDLTTSKYISMFGGSNILQPNVDYFEERRMGQNIEVLTRLFRNGEFLLSETFPTSAKYTIHIFELYQLWYSALRYFDELYEKYGYYGPLRIWLETRGLIYDNIQVGLEWGYNYQWKYKRDHILTWVDTKVEELIDPVEVINKLIRYFAQGCGADVTEQKLMEYETRISSYRR